ncbi:hypothetical protein YW5DRAFT_04998 [Streptomyces sp. Ncost-T6T-1]|uniref:hypothetical protein n=1 Tax=Streptomyces sp. Ncost-T6T-1 TaxID=1100828 RepID=UPI000805A694|nr:hypothetical protein [Streptomyces sp. Ncost-T6T-1]SBU95059.1 hypothetical protein YW5DRAFT_04998 [Streptomyces sp. Ncost-T6T-1]
MDVRRAVQEPREIDASGLPMEHAQAVILDALRALTECEEPFAAVLLMPAPQEGRTPPPSGDVPSAADRIRTLKAIRPGLTEFCRGLAFVAPADIPAERAAAVHSGEQLWGCPTTATQDVTAARAWAEERSRE